MSFLAFKQGVNKQLIQPLIIQYRKKKFDFKNLSIISCNCVGGIISHDYGLKFMSPTINLFFPASDFIEFVENLKFYLTLDLEFYDTHSLGYPICTLGNLTIHFVHYISFDDCNAKWNDRKARVNFNNIFLLFTNQNGCNEELVKRFSKLPYNKVMFSSSSYGYDFVRFIPTSGSGESNPIDTLFHFVGFTGKRKYEDFFKLEKEVLT